MGSHHIQTRSAESVIDVFGAHNLEKMAVEDGNGNKAKLSRTKDNGIKVEYSSTVLM